MHCIVFTCVFKFYSHIIAKQEKKATANTNAIKVDAAIDSTASPGSSHIMIESLSKITGKYNLRVLCNYVHIHADNRELRAHDELFSPSLLNLWQTGSSWFGHSKIDEDIDVI